MNPCAGRADLPDFESGPFNHLGTTPNKKMRLLLYLFNEHESIGLLGSQVGINV